MSSNLEVKNASGALVSPSSEESQQYAAGPRGGTLQDKQDMLRIGRDQQLNVSWRKKLQEKKIFGEYWQAVLEKLSIHFSPWFYCGSYVHLGSGFDVSEHFVITMIPLKDKH